MSLKQKIKDLLHEEMDKVLSEQGVHISSKILLDSNEPDYQCAALYIHTYLQMINGTSWYDIEHGINHDFRNEATRVREIRTRFD